MRSMTIRQLLKIRPAIDLFYGLYNQKNKSYWVKNEDLQLLFRVLIRLDEPPTITLTPKLIELVTENQSANRICFDGYIVDQKGARFLLTLLAYVHGHINFSPIFRTLQKAGEIKQLSTFTKTILTTPFPRLTPYYLNKIYRIPLSVTFSQNNDQIIGIQTKYPIILR